MPHGADYKKTAKLIVLILFMPAGIVWPQAQGDTAAITKNTSEAYAIARRNPDISILMAHRAMSDSRKISYTKGMADASLALGMAYLAKYNPGDSAWYYNNLALSLYGRQAVKQAWDAPAMGFRTFTASGEMPFFRKIRHPCPATF